jgi:hypothetical protein
MTPADNTIVGLLSLALAAGGTVFALAFGILFWLNTSRLLPAPRLRVVYWLGVAIFGPILLAIVPLTIEAAKAVAVIASFGWDAFADGLRVVGKRGRLSDGRFLSTFWTAAIVPMMWTASMLFICVAVGWHMHFHPVPGVAEPSADALGNKPAGPPPGPPDVRH